MEGEQNKSKLNHTKAVLKLGHELKHAAAREDNKSFVKHPKKHFEKISRHVWMP
jgi:hypothetical protein